MGKSKHGSESSSDTQKEESSSDYESEEFLPVEASNPVLKENMEALMKTLKETLISSEKKHTRLGNGKNSLLIALNRYQKCLDKTSVEEHRDYFMKVYKRYRVPIVANKDDRWLRKNQIKITFGKPKYGIRIWISAIYNTARELSKSANEKLEAFGHTIHDDDLDRNDHILLYLYRVFREFAPEQDHEKLTEIIIELEKLLDVESEYVSKTDASAPVMSGMNTIGNFASSLMNGLRKTAEDNNIPQGDIPDISKVFTELTQNKKLRTGLAKLTENEEFKGLFNNIISNLGKEGGGAPSIDKLISGVASVMSDPEMGQVISGAVSTIQENVSDGPSGLTTDTTSHTSPNGPTAKEPQQLLLDLPPPPDT